MVGQGVLRECLLASDVELVCSIGRSPLGIGDDRLEEVIVEDIAMLPAAIADRIAEFDACLFCAGVSSAGMAERDYTRLTYDLTVGVARALVERNPGMVFVYISGAGTSIDGRSMWARVKGRTEEALASLPFSGAYSLRPAAILPVNGERSKVRATRLTYRFGGPIFGLIRLVAPHFVLTTEMLGRVMLALARKGPGRQVLEARDIYAEALLQLGA